MAQAGVPTGVGLESVEEATVELEFVFEGSLEYVLDFTAYVEEEVELLVDDEITVDSLFDPLASEILFLLLSIP